VEGSGHEQDRSNIPEFFGAPGENEDKCVRIAGLRVGIPIRTPEYEAGVPAILPRHVIERG
jgi:hypothetical protein